MTNTKLEQKTEYCPFSSDCNHVCSEEMISSKGGEEFQCPFIPLKYSEKFKN